MTCLLGERSTLNAERSTLKWPEGWLRLNLNFRRTLAWERGRPRPHSGADVRAPKGLLPVDHRFDLPVRFARRDKRHVRVFEAEGFQVGEQVVFVGQREADAADLAAGGKRGAGHLVSRGLDRSAVVDGKDAQHRGQ